MDVIVEHGEGRLVGIEIAGFRADGLAINDIAVALFDGKDGNIHAVEGTNVQRAAVEILVIFKRHIAAACDGRSRNRVQAVSFGGVDREYRAIEAAQYAAGVAGLAADTCFCAPLLDGDVHKQSGDADDVAVLVELVLFGAREPQLAPHTIAVPSRDRV